MEVVGSATQHHHRRHHQIGICRGDDRCKRRKDLTYILSLSTFIFSTYVSLHVLLAYSQSEAVDCGGHLGNSVRPPPPRKRIDALTYTKLLRDSLSDGVTNPVAFLPFEVDQPKFIVIVTYENCGWELLEKLLMVIPDVFHVSEPLDSFYSAFYGTTQGRSYPSGTINHANGFERMTPDSERNVLNSFLETLLSCSVNHLPIETLLSIQGWANDEMLASYNRCPGGKLKSLLARCRSPMEEYCGSRFGEVRKERRDQCFNILANSTYREVYPEYSSTYHMFRHYHQCSKILRESVNKLCIHLLRDSCRSRKVRIVKLVQASMASVESLLENIPNLRVIHLLRDPRGVVLSRMRGGKAGGPYPGESSAEESSAKEARVYCQQVIRDIKVRRRLDERHPGKILNIIYDNLVSNFASYATDIYKYLDVRMTNATKRSVWDGGVDGDSPQHPVNWIEDALQWEKHLPIESYIQIMTECKQFFHILEHGV